MSFAVRRAALRVAPRTRGFATAAGKSYQEEQQARMAHAAETTELWRKISFYVCLPSVAACMLWVRQFEAAHEEHAHHLIEENGGKRPEPPAYEYLNRRTSGAFPWGNNTLFFNPKVNKDMEAAAED